MIEQPTGRYGNLRQVQILWHLIAFIVLIAAGCAREEPQKTSPTAQDAARTGPPNVVVIFVDDMGYGDLGVYGNPSIRTPALDRMAANGQKWTNFYSAAPVCTPSRAGLLTGRLPVRSGTAASGGGPAVFFPFSAGGLPSEEVTIAEILKERGYVTAAIGKWHLGHFPEFLPTRQGFDSYFGIPYSNDMNATDRFLGWDREIDSWEPAIDKFDVPLMRNEDVIERPADQFTITRRYTEEAARFIEGNRDRPFFLYLAHNLPHVPLFASDEFEGQSPAGYYADVIEELDWSAGEIVAALERAGVERNTLIVFTSDNGPWLRMRQHGGNSGPLRDGKGTTWDGGMRVPAIFYWPDRLSSAVVTEAGSALDLLPTLAALTGAELPADRVLDGVDLSSVLLGGTSEPLNRRPIYFYRGDHLYAIRNNGFKIHFTTELAYLPETQKTEHDPPLLFDVRVDPGENFDVAARHPEIVEDFLRLRQEHLDTVVPVPNQLNIYDQADRDAYAARYR